MLGLFLLILIAGINGGQISRFKVSNPSQLHVDPLQELKCARKYRDSDDGIKLEVSSGICLQDDSDFTEQGYVYLDKTHVLIKYNPPIVVGTPQTCVPVKTQGGFGYDRGIKATFTFTEYSKHPAFGLMASEDGSQDMILHVKLWVETNQIVVDCKVGGTYQVDTRHVISVSDVFQLYQAYTLELRFVNGNVKIFKDNVHYTTYPLILSPADATVFCMKDGDVNVWATYEVTEVQFYTMEEFEHELVFFMVNSQTSDDIMQP